MDVKLVVMSGKHAGQAIRVPLSKFFIGRAEDCHLRVQSTLVSRHHCVIVVEENFVGVRDFGSKNGTYVNGERIKVECELRPGDHLKVGMLEFEVRFQAPVAMEEEPVAAAPPSAPVSGVPETAHGAFDPDDWFAEESAGHVTTSVQGQATPPTRVEESTVVANLDQELLEKDPNADVVGVWTGRTAKPKQSSQDAAAEMLKNFFRR